MADPRDTRDELLDLEDDSARTLDQLDDQVQKATERLLLLKRQAEQLEREKHKLEELSRRQAELERGRSEMADKFTRALVIVQRETDQCLKRLELLKTVQEEFGGRLREIEEIDPQDWPAAEVNKELSRALSIVEDARSEFTKAYAKIAPAEESGGGPSPFDDESADYGQEKSFTYWLMAGFAFTLPLFALGMLGLVLWFLHLAAQ